MTTRTRLLLMALAVSGVGGCTLVGDPPPDAYARNIGPGSSIFGRPDSNLGTPNSGVTHMPGATAAGGNTISGN